MYKKIRQIYVSKCKNTSNVKIKIKKLIRGSLEKFKFFELLKKSDTIDRKR